MPTKLIQTTFTLEDIAKASGGGVALPDSGRVWVRCPEWYEPSWITIDEIVTDGDVSVVYDLGYAQRYAEIVDVLLDVDRGSDMWATGGEYAEMIASEWAEAGFGAQEVSEWINTAGCWEAAQARCLYDHGYTPDDVMHELDRLPRIERVGDYTVDNVIAGLGDGS